MYTKPVKGGRGENHFRYNANLNVRVWGMSNYNNVRKINPFDLKHFPVCGIG